MLVADRVPQKFLESMSSREVCYRPGMSLEELLCEIPEYHVLVFRSRLRISREVIDRGVQLKVLARYGVGLDNVDIEYAVKRGVAVVNASGSLSAGLRRRYWRGVSALSPWSMTAAGLSV